MQAKAAFLLLGAALTSGTAAARIGTTLTGWDCCKPGCAWPNVASRSGASGTAKVCGKNDRPLSTSAGANEPSSCASGTAPGNGYLCSDYSPRPMSEQLSYGFVITPQQSDCCKCYQLRWVAGPAKGKRMEVQAINVGGSDEDDNREFTIVVPGGGVGPHTRGCESQYGSIWGRQYGGVSYREECEKLPEKLRAGCYWRWNWARGDINGWPIEYDQISCPSYLTGISGCRPR